MFEIFDGPILLESEKVRVRSMSITDVEPIMTFALNEPLWSFIHHPLRQLDAPNIEHFVRNQLQDHRIRRGIPLIVMDIANKQVAGVLRYEYLSFRHQHMEIGGRLLGQRHEAILTEAMGLLLRHAFEKRSSIRVGMKAEVSNERAHNFLAQIGASEEGILRNYYTDFEGITYDLRIYSIIASEWHEKVSHRFA
jgi:RimJ/RimL family protein N-acetyltransferase